jgi:O-methyltransferase involved in polyketide biosynthesis
MTSIKSLDPSKPNTARMYDYWLGGKDNFLADRQAADAVRERRPDVADLALENKKFLTRAVKYVAAKGVRQFLDVGSGLPTSPVRELGSEPLWLATHEAAKSQVPDAMIAYVDYEPVAVRHSQALLASGGGEVVAVRGDLNAPAAILADPGIRGAGFDPGESACVIFGCVLHFQPPEVARQKVAEFAASVAPGSYVIISVGYDGSGSADGDFADAYNAQDGLRIYQQSLAGVNALFAGLDVVPPGIVDSASWHDGGPAVRRAAVILAGVAMVR